MTLQGLTLREVLKQLVESCDIEVGIAVPADASCCADGCDELAVAKTLTGIAFCSPHFSEFYSGGSGPTLKPGVVYMTREGEQ